MDHALIKLFGDPHLNDEVLHVFLELVAFFHKEKRQFSSDVLQAAQKCTTIKCSGDLSSRLPAIYVWFLEQALAEDLSEQNLANLVEANIRAGSAGLDSAWSTLSWLKDDLQRCPRPALDHESQPLADGARCARSN